MTEETTTIEEYLMSDEPCLETEDNCKRETELPSASFAAVMAMICLALQMFHG